jgi:hypothetical protein
VHGSQPHPSAATHDSQPALPQLLANTGTVVGPSTRQHGASAGVEPTWNALDVTEQVRVRKRRGPSPTTLIHTGLSARKKPLLVVGGLALAAGIAAFIALRGHEQLAAETATQPATAADRDEMVPTEVERPFGDAASADHQALAKEVAPAQPMVEPAASATESPTNTKSRVPAETTANANPGTSDQATEEIATSKVGTAESKVGKPSAAKVDTKHEAKPEPKLVEPKVDRKPVAKATEKKAIKSVVKKPATPKATKPEPKKEPKKEPTWNADSPFMPVRTTK